MKGRETKHSYEGAEMYINSIDSIDNEKGKFLILLDYGSEGIAVMDQYETVEKAIGALPTACTSSAAIVCLPDVKFTL